MENRVKEFISRITEQEKSNDAMYRKVASIFGLSDCAMWVLYFIFSADEALTQQDLIERMMYPKQSINTAVMGLAKRGWVELQMIPGTPNRKKIILTPAGNTSVRQTAGRLRLAEERAVAGISPEKMETFITLYHEIYEAVRQQLRQEGLAE